MTLKDVDARRLKAFAVQLKLEDPLREILLSLNDKVEAREFLAQLPIYLRLSPNRRK